MVNGQVSVRPYLRMEDEPSNKSQHIIKWKTQPSGFRVDQLKTLAVVATDISGRTHYDDCVE